MTIALSYDANTGAATGARISEAALAANEVACTEAQAREWWRYEVVAGAVVALAPTKAELRTHAEGKRRLVEYGGLLVNVAASGPAKNVAIATDPDGQRYVQGAVALMAQSPAAAPVKWLNGNTQIELSADEVARMGVALGVFVQATWQTLYDARVAIEAGTITTTAQIDALSWPTA